MGISRVVVAVGVAVLAGACSAEIGEAAGELDGAAALPDAADPADATPGAAIDAPPPPPDAAPDAAIPSEPDASTEDLCTAAYASVPGYELCSTPAGACTFIAFNEATSCNQHCAARGGICLGALDNEVGDCVDLEPNQDGIGCATIGKQDLLCTCTVP